MNLLGHLRHGLAPRAHRARVLQLAVVGLQARKAHGGVARDGLRQRHGGVARRHSAAVLPHVDFNEHVDARGHPCHGGTQRLHALQAVDHDAQLAISARHALGQIGHAHELERRNHLVADEHVGGAHVDQRLCFRHLLHAHARCAGLHLHAANVGAFVRFGVGAQLHVVALAKLGHALHVAVECVQVNDQARGRQIAHGLAHLAQALRGQGVKRCVHRARP